MKEKMSDKIFYKILRLIGKLATCKLSEKENIGIDIINNCEEFERCVICGKLTNILISTPIDRRANYEIRIGQICSECARKHQNKRWTTADSKQLLNMMNFSEKTK